MSSVSKQSSLPKATEFLLVSLHSSPILIHCYVESFWCVQQSDSISTTADCFFLENILTRSQKCMICTVKKKKKLMITYGFRTISSHLGLLISWSSWTLGCKAEITFSRSLSRQLADSTLSGSSRAPISADPKRAPKASPQSSNEAPSRSRSLETGKVKKKLCQSLLKTN